MVWQDVIFVAGSLLTVVFLAPAVRDANARVPLATSLPKMALGAIYAVTFATMEMYLATIGLLATGIMWCLLAVYRSPQGRAWVAARRATAVAQDSQRGLHRLDD